MTVSRKGNPYRDDPSYAHRMRAWDEGAASVEARLLSDEAVEAAALGIRGDASTRSWDAIPESARERWKSLARSALVAALSAVREGEGR